MTVTDVRKDLESMTMTMTARFEAPIERIWRLWSDPRQLERWWGPPSHPTTVVDHDLTAGGRVTYYMTGPDGERFDGEWEVVEVDAPNRLRIKDADLDDDGRPTDGNGMTGATITLRAESPATTTMEIETHFFSREEMEKVLEMGAEQGTLESIGKIDALLAEDG
jgi:uncharacterized protein YndB with AHSA1/START domain